MGETGSSVHRISARSPHLHLLFLLLLLLFLLLPAATLGLDLGGLLAALGGATKPKPCPPQCSCSTKKAEDIMQSYVTRYLPDMGSHMKPGLESEARSLITTMTSWLGSMADLECRLSQGEWLNLTDVMQASTLSFKAVRMSCEPGAGVVWDVSPFNAFLNVLEVKGCQLDRAEDSLTLAVPLSLWVLHLERVPAESVGNLDLSTATQLLALSVTHSKLPSLPQSWSNTFLHRLMLARLSHNDLNRYECEVKALRLESLNLDHNNLTTLPSCVLDGSRYTSHLSVRHNRLQSLKELFFSRSVATFLPTPQLSYLDLAHNQLTSLRALKKIQLLLGLDISHNGLVNIMADTFSMNPALTWLDLSNNQLEHVLDGLLGGLVLMRYLNLSNNYLRTFDFDQSPLSTKVVTMDLRHNRLTYPPFADTGYVAPRLSRIAAAHNPFTCDCSMGVFLQFLSMLNNSKHQNWFGLGYWDHYDGDLSVDQPYMDTNEFMCSEPPDMKGLRLTSLSFKDACPLLRGCPPGCLCELLKGSAKHVSVDCSDAENMTDLPTYLPVVSDTPMVLFINRSGLRRLEHRPYLHLLTELHAGYSKLSSVTSAAMQAMRNITVLALHNNYLRSLPAVTQNLTLESAVNISLGGNPWTCGCHDLWMPHWMDKHAAALYNANNMRCRWTGKLVSLLNSTDLNCGIFNYLPLVIALSMVLGLAAVVASLLVKYRLEVLVFLYSRFRVRPFDMYKYDQAHAYLFDVFVSFSQHDYRWVVEKLVDQLENRPRPYRLCIHLRDFPVGAPIADSVAWAVDNSRCTLLVLTRDFLASEWCRYEFRAAHARLLKDPSAKLLIVVHGPLDARILDRELLAYLRTHTYLRTEDKWFWSKLEYALPCPQEAVGLVGIRRARAEAAPAMELDTFLPIAMAAGDVSPKADGNPAADIPVPV